MKGRGPVWLQALALLAITAPVSADPPPDVKGECVDANTRAQTFRREGKLADARRELRLCGDPRCPAMVRDDCAQRLDEVERAQPTIVFDVRDTSGQDVVAAEVSVDGKPLADRLDGRALAVDPGEHTFAFAAPGLPAVTRQLVLREGEKERRERIVLAEALPREPPAVAPGPPPSRGSGTRLAAVVLGGVGLSGVATGAVFGALTIDNWSRSKGECGSSQCPNRPQAVADQRSAYRTGTVSDVAFAAGGVFLATALVLWFSAPAAHDPAASTALRVSPSFGPAGGALTVGGGF